MKDNIYVYEMPDEPTQCFYSLWESQARHILIAKWPINSKQFAEFKLKLLLLGTPNAVFHIPKEILV